MYRLEVHHIAIEAAERAEDTVAQSRGAFDDRGEDWLYVRRRAANHAEDLAGRRLLPQRLCQRRPKTFVLLDELSQRQALLLAAFIALPQPSHLRLRLLQPCVVFCCLGG